MTLRTVPCEPGVEEHCECFGNHNTACCWCKWNPTDDEFVARERAGEDPGRCSGVVELFPPDVVANLAMPGIDRALRRLPPWKGWTP